MSKHAFSSVICRDDTRQVHRPSDRELDVNWKSPVQGESPPVQVKESSLLNILGSMCIFNCLFLYVWEPVFSRSGQDFC